MFFFHYKSETDNAFLIFSHKYCYYVIFQSDGGLKNEKPRNAFQHGRACLGKCRFISAGNMALKIFPLHLYDRSLLENTFVQITSAFILTCLGFCFQGFAYLYHSAFHKQNSVLNSQIRYLSRFKPWPAPGRCSLTAPPGGVGREFGD